MEAHRPKISIALTPFPIFAAPSHNTISTLADLLDGHKSTTVPTSAKKQISGGAAAATSLTYLM